MNEETLLKTIEELIKEINKLKQRENILITSIKTIKDKATLISATNERKAMIIICEGILSYVDALTKKLDGEEVSFIKSNIKEGDNYGK